MNFGINKDFCLWLVPASDGRVRKVRFTLMRALMLALLFGAISSGFLFIASDYARVQMLRARHYFSLKQIAAERDNLRQTKQQLEGKVGTLVSAQVQAEAYEQKVRERLAQLADIINSAKLKHLVEEKNEPSLDDHSGNGEVVTEDNGPLAHNTNRPRSEAGGLGGAEIDCVSGGINRCSIFNDSDNELISLAKVVQPGQKSDILATIEHYISLVRTLPLGLPGGGGEIRSGFGPRVSPFGGGIKMHEGIDIAYDYGTPIYANGDATVSEVGRTGTYGLVVDLSHSHRLSTRYAHLSRAAVKIGQEIKKGDLIGYAGSSGHSTGPHLHYEVRLAGQPINPFKFIRLATELSLLL